MTLVDYIDLLRPTAHRAGLDANNLSNDEFVTLRDIHGQRLHEIWREADWPDIVRTEKRYFRIIYDASGVAPFFGSPDQTFGDETPVFGQGDPGTMAGATIAAGAEYYWPLTRKYYQTLLSFTAESPTTDPTTAAGALNSAYWAECLTSYSADNYDPTHAYDVGDTVYYPGTDRYYALHTATPAGTVPTTAAFWGVLTEFDRYVSFTQAGQSAFDDPLRAWDRNPKDDGRAQELTAFQSNLGAQVLDEVVFCWLEFRIPCPLLWGDTFDPARAYAVAEQAYFSSGTYRGNFYDCVTAAAPGETPATHAAKWSVAPIPLRFARWLINAGASDYARTDDKTSLSDREAVLAEGELDRLKAAVFGQNLHSHRVTVHCR